MLIKQEFTIGDFENISGIKAHTLRVWEKRYDLFVPKRKSRNVRLYSLDDLKKLLNFTTLYTNGVKISKIAGMTQEAVKQMVSNLDQEGNSPTLVLSDFKMAMYAFDQYLFDSTYNRLIQKMDFERLFEDCFMPLLSFIGRLWQTDSITPAHEHFISALIQRKLQVESEKLPKSDDSDKTFVLYLPEGELHELGLLYINYQLLKFGYKTIYLGANVPLENLYFLKEQFNEITFVSYFVVSPENHEIELYLSKASELIGTKRNRFWAIGKKLQHFNPPLANMKFFLGMNEILGELNSA
jgi:DNA-binding transcriptional MerR regulator